MLYFLDRNETINKFIKSLDNIHTVETKINYLGTASTGTAIASLSGVAATNVTLAALGGDSLAVGGGGMALGTAIISGATLEIGLLVGGIIFNVTGSSLSNKVDEAWSQMKNAEKEIDKICAYMMALSNISNKYL